MKKTSRQQKEAGNSNVEMEAARPSTAGEEELQLQSALAMSKEEHDEEDKKRKADEVKYQLAIEESKRENPDEPVSGPAHRDTLLQLAAGGGGGPGGSDPWGGMPLKDPWAPTSAPPPSLPPPGGHPSSLSNNDPWVTPTQPPSLQTPVNNDPWAPPAYHPSTAGNSNVEMEAARPSTAGEDELQLQSALAMSKEEHDEEEKKIKADEVKSQLAIEESKRENPDEPVSGPAHTDTLLQLAAGGGGPGGSDPWGGMPLKDPWAPTSAPPPSLPPPGGHPSSLSNNDPWAAPTQPPYLQTPVNNDPWAPPTYNPSTAQLAAGSNGGDIEMSNNNDGEDLSDDKLHSNFAPDIPDHITILSNAAMMPDGDIYLHSPPNTPDHNDSLLNAAMMPDGDIYIHSPPNTPDHNDSLFNDPMMPDGDIYIPSPPNTPDHNDSLFNAPIIPDVDMYYNFPPNNPDHNTPLFNDSLFNAHMPDGETNIPRNILGQKTLSTNAQIPNSQVIQPPPRLRNAITNPSLQSGQAIGGQVTVQSVQPQFQIAVQNGHISPQIRNQHLTPHMSVMLQDILHLQQVLQLLMQQQQQLVRKEYHGPVWYRQLNYVMLTIHRTRQQIQQQKQQLEQAQHSLAKQDPPPAGGPGHVVDPNKELLKDVPSSLTELLLDEEAAELQLHEDAAELQLDEDAAKLQLHEDAARLQLHEEADDDMNLHFPRNILGQKTLSTNAQIPNSQVIQTPPSLRNAITNPSLQSGQAIGGQVPVQSVQQQVSQQQITQQLQMAVQAGHVSPQTLNQQLTPNMLVMLQKILELQQLLQQLMQQRQQLGGTVYHGQHQQFNDVMSTIHRIRHQIQQQKQQLEQAQHSLAKQDPPPAGGPGHVVDPNKELLKDVPSSLTELLLDEEAAELQLHEDGAELQLDEDAAKLQLHEDAARLQLHEEADDDMNLHFPRNILGQKTLSTNAQIPNSQVIQTPPSLRNAITNPSLQSGQAIGGQVPVQSVQQQVSQQQITQQLQMAVQAGHVSPQILNQQLTPNMLVMLQKILELQQLLQQLMQQQQQLGGTVYHGQHQQFNDVMSTIHRVRHQIQQQKQQLEQAQHSLAKQDPPPAGGPGHVVDPNKELLKDAPTSLTELLLDEEAAEKAAGPPPGLGERSVYVRANCPIGSANPNSLAGSNSGSAPRRVIEQFVPGKQWLGKTNSGHSWSCSGGTGSLVLEKVTLQGLSFENFEDVPTVEKILHHGKDQQAVESATVKKIGMISFDTDSSGNKIVLGRGDSSVVFRGQYGTMPVALKRLQTKNGLDKAKREIEIYSTMVETKQRVNIVGYRNVNEDVKEQLHYLVMELCHGTLTDLVENTNKWQNICQELSPAQKPNITKYDLIKQAINGIFNLHLLGVVHTDIKPSNLLVNFQRAKIVVKICDYGVSREISHHYTVMTRGTVGWASPELSRMDVKLVDERTDVFSLGLVIYYILRFFESDDADRSQQSRYLFGEMMDADDEDNQMAQTAEKAQSNIDKGDTTIQERHLDELSKAEADLVRRMTRLEPASERPCIEECMQHLLLKSPQEKINIIVSATGEKIGMISFDTDSYGNKIVLGRGDGSVVFRGQYGTMPVALKRLQTKNGLDKAKREIEIYSTVAEMVETKRSVNIVGYRNVNVDVKEQLHYLMMELCHGTLTDLIENTEKWQDICQEHSPAQKPNITEYDLIKQAINGISSLHLLGVVHRYIKPSNLLVKIQRAKIVVKICDYGVSRELSHHYTVMTRGTVGWASPELSRMDVKLVDERTDVFSLGLVIYYILRFFESDDADRSQQNRYLFGEMMDADSEDHKMAQTAEKAQSNIDKGDTNIQEHHLDELSKAEADLVRRMTRLEPVSERPCIEECMQHLLLKSPQEQINIIVAYGALTEITDFHYIEGELDKHKVLTQDWCSTLGNELAKEVRHQNRSETLTKYSCLVQTVGNKKYGSLTEKKAEYHHVEGNLDTGKVEWSLSMGAALDNVVQSQFKKDKGKLKQYSCLVRTIRNKYMHRSEIKVKNPTLYEELWGKGEEDVSIYLSYFTKPGRFPNLMFDVWKVSEKHLIKHMKEHFHHGTCTINYCKLNPHKGKHQ